MEDTLIVGCSASQDLARSIARQASCPYCSLHLSSFPDGEFLIRFPIEVKGKHVVLVQTLHMPNEKIIEVVLAASTARELGATSVTLVAPYLAYMRQDKRFHPGESISSKGISKIINTFVDRMITVDPHIHRYMSLEDIYTCRPVNLTAADCIATFIHKKIKNPVIVGPDAESLQWASRVSGTLKTEVHVLKKKRDDAEHVHIKFKGTSLKGKSAVIVDDIISTGHTMMEVVKDVKRLGAKKIYCIGVHGVFVKHAYELLRKSGAEVITTNTIRHKSNKLDVSALVAKELVRSLSGKNDGDDVNRRKLLDERSYF